MAHVDLFDFWNDLGALWAAELRVALEVVLDEGSEPARRQSEAKKQLERMQEREVKRVGYIVVSSDRGLCGGLNTNAFKLLVREMREWKQQGIETDICAIGQKGASFFRNYGGNVVAAVTHLGDSPSADQLIGSVKVMLDAFAAHGPSLQANPPVAVGHRVVHGGARFFEPTLVTPLVLINIEDLSVLAPLHNPGAVQGIRAAQEAFDTIPHVAVFDTAFHQTLAPAAYTYAIDRELAEQHREERLREEGY